MTLFRLQTWVTTELSKGGTHVLLSGDATVKGDTSAEIKAKWERDMKRVFQTWYQDCEFTLFSIATPLPADWEAQQYQQHLLQAP